MSNDLPPGALEHILSTGLRRRMTVWAQLAQLWSAVGPGNLFLGTVTRIIAAVTLSIGVVALVSTTEGSLAHLFALAPLLLLSLLGLVEGAERLGPLAELRRTLRHSGPQVVAFRILIFGIAGMGFGLAVALLLGVRGTSAARTVMVASLAVSAAAVLTIALLRRITSTWQAVMVPLVWTGFWLMIATLLGDAWEALLAGIPDIVGWAMVLVAACVVARQVRSLLLGRVLTIKELTHAAG